MANKKISEETAIGGGFDGTEEIRIAKSGANYKVTAQEIADLAGGVTDILLADLQTLYNAGTMIPGWYKITDRDIWVEALNGSSVSPNGKRLMYCPSHYDSLTDGNGNVWIGVWNGSLSPTSGELVVWGGKVWVNIGANVGTAVDDFTLDSEWTVIDKIGFSKNEYIKLAFGCSFDIVNDWISKQWDDKGNIHGIDFLEQDTLYSFPENPVDFNDWNLETSGNVYSDNKCIACFNNMFSGYYYISSVYNPLGIFGNKIKGMIYNNVVAAIANNSNEGNISSNINNCLIRWNINRGRIALNTCITIESNLNNGAIYNNSCDTIKNNSNNDVIGTNSNDGGIDYNSNCGSITGNSNNGGISNNSNNGSIYSNGATVASIAYNSNNGDIGSNNCVGDLTYNKCGGTISNNSCTGIIRENSNIQYIDGNGSNITAIFQNSNGGTIDNNNNVGDIANNKNNGSISGVTGTCNIRHNINNGSIGGSHGSDVTDSIVNK